eukprot:4725545-Pleurochrysis_carterae.AAC.2
MRLVVTRYSFVPPNTTVYSMPTSLQGATARAEEAKFNCYSLGLGGTKPVRLRIGKQGVTFILELG